MKVLRILLLGGVFVFFMMAFLPKKNLFYALEAYLATKSIYLSNEKLSEKFFGLDIHTMEIAYETIMACQVKKVSSSFFIFWNSIDVENIHLQTMGLGFLPKTIESLQISYGVLNPFIFSIDAISPIGVIQGNYNLRSKMLVLTLVPSKEAKTQYSSILKNFKEDKGSYSYEKHIQLY